jgi:surface polysaccharide O-acyltransferase-like enzyme
MAHQDPLIPAASVRRAGADQAGVNDLAAPNRLLWPDLVRVYAIAGVVLLHSEAVPNTQFGSIPLETWWRTNIYHAFVCTCIPLFVMLSGALLLTQSHWEPGRFAWRRLGKLLPPLLIWTLVYAAWRRYIWHHELGFEDILLSFVTGAEQPVFPHLWFVYTILSLYLLVPVLRVYFLHSSLNSQLYFAALWIAASVVKPLIGEHYDFNVGYYLDPFYGYIGYFLLGATISRYLPQRLDRGWVLTCAAIIAAGYLATMLGTYALSAQAGKLDDALYRHLSPTVIPMSIASFLLLRHLGYVWSGRSTARSLLRRAVTTLGKLAFGIYLVHALMIVLLESGRLGFVLNPTTFQPLLSAPLMAVIVFAASAAFTAVSQRTPALRWVTP